MAGKPGPRKPGAGRPPGTANVKTREIAEQALREGISPLEVMINTMRKLYRASEAGQIVEGMDGKKLTPLGLAIMAADVASKAAPYCHPRLNAIEHTGKGGTPLNPPELTIIVNGKPE